MEPSSRGLARSISSSAVPAEPLRVLLDARKIQDGGIGSYIRNIVWEFSERADVALTVICNSGTSAALRLPQSVSIIEDSAPRYSLDELVGLPRRLPLSRFDIFHSPHYTLPYRLGIPSVVTVHDIIHITHPEKWYYPIVSKVLIGSALRRATKIVAVSNSTRQQLVSVFGGENQESSIAKKITVVPNSIDPRFLDLRKNPIEGEHGNYLLAVVSTAKPHKGLQDLLDAFQLVIKSGEVNTIPQLVCVGVGASAEWVAGRACELGIEKYVNPLGIVSFERLAALYRNSLGVVVSSLTEGFGLPALEGIVSGSRVIARPVPALQEVLTDNDIVASDFSVGALAEALRAGIEKGRSAVSRVPPPAGFFDRFSREKVCGDLIQVYRTAVEREAT